MQPAPSWFTRRGRGGEGLCSWRSVRI